MALSTAFTGMFGIRHPIVLAPMGGTAGGALASAVSRAGGLGMLGAGDGDPDWLAREVSVLTARTDRPWGVGFLTWAIDADAVARALAYRPRAVMFSFGDPAPYAGMVRRSDAALIIQVTDLDEARHAADLGADVIVAQGTEAGGHGARRGRSTLPFVPAVADLVHPVPVLAAGGIADGRGVAAALALGAAGAVIGTRFQATSESLADPVIVEAILGGRGRDTERSSVLDVVRGSKWPSAYTARTLGHPHLDRWRGREDEAATDPRSRQDYRDDRERGVIPPQPVWAGEAVDLIDDLPSAVDLVAAMARRAGDALAGAAGIPEGRLDDELPVAPQWFRFTVVDERTTVVDEPYTRDLLHANAWHLRGRDRDVLVDCGLGVAALVPLLRERFGREPVLVLTHAHLDHMGSAHEFGEVWAHPLEAIEDPAPGSLLGPVLAAQLGLDVTMPAHLLKARPDVDFDPGTYRVRPAKLTRALTDGDIVDLGDRALRVLHLPGHSPGSVVLFDAADGTLFSGDVIYDDELLDYLPGGDPERYAHSLRRLRDLPVNLVHPGHGPSFGRERLHQLIDDYLRIDRAT
jgi:nitronate monooxygenase